MKIWILTSETPFYNPGGIARYVDNFARYLGVEGHEVRVFGRSESEDSGEVAPGYRYHAVVPRWKRSGEKCDSPRPDDHPAFPYNILDYWNAFSYQMADEVMTAIEAEGPPDVIESQEYCAVPYYLLQRKLTGRGPLENIPIVVNNHSPDFIIRENNEEPRYRFPEYWTGRMEVASMYAADALICPSQYLCDQLEELLDEDGLRVTHFPLPWTDPKAYLEGDVEIEPNSVLYLGRLEVRKGVLRMLEHCEKLWRGGEVFQLTMAGSDTPYYPRSTTVQQFIEKRYAHRIESGQLILPGTIPHAELMPLIRKSGFVVIPSIWENWPNTCIEAMSLGKVVVGSRHGGQAEMIGDDNQAGFLFSWEEPKSFESAFRKALDLDSATRERMGQTAIKRIQGICDPSVVLPKRVAHFEGLIREHRPRRVFPFSNHHARHSRAKEGWLGDSREIPGMLSVVIPYYNLGPLVEETVESARQSDYDNLEIVLVNDGSSDESTLATLEKLREAGIPALRIVDIDNGGLANARNVGVREAHGEYVALLDADDQVTPDFFSHAIDIIRRYENVHVVYSWERYFEASHDIFPCWNFEFPYLLGHNMTCPVSVLYRQSYLAFGPTKREMAYNFEDYELWISLFEAGCGGVSIHEPLSLYRIRKDSIWQEHSSRDQLLHLYNLIVDFHPQVYAEYGPELFKLQNANGPAQKWIKPATLSPFDEYESWSRRRIKNLEKEAEKWWKKSVNLDKKLAECDREKGDIWHELQDLKKERGTTDDG